jgi:hypothetical protein
MIFQSNNRIGQCHKSLEHKISRSPAPGVMHNLLLIPRDGEGDGWIRWASFRSFPTTMKQEKLC